MPGLRVGVLGGTFNPPHIGHLICAQEALQQLELDEVVFIPAAVPPHKVIPGGDPGPAVRLGLVEAAIAGDERFSASGIELQRSGPSYSADTLALLRQLRPEDDLTFIVGGDMAHSLPTWHEPARLLELCTLGVAERSGVRRDDILTAIADLNPGDRVRFFDMPRIDVSSTDVRRRVARGESIRYLVPDAVAARIDELGLYRSSSGVAV